MTAKSKYDIDDTVYFLNSNKIQQAKIVNVRIVICGVKNSEICIEGYDYSSTNISYSLSGVMNEKNERDLFKSKEELLKSL